MLRQDSSSAILNLKKKKSCPELKNHQRTYDTSSDILLILHWFLHKKNSFSTDLGPEETFKFWRFQIWPTVLEDSGSALPMPIAGGTRLSKVIFPRQSPLEGHGVEILHQTELLAALFLCRSQLEGHGVEILRH